MKTVITVNKQEIEEAVRDYIFDRASTGYQYEFGDGVLTFTNKDGEIGFFTGSIEVEIVKKEDKKDEV